MNKKIDVKNQFDRMKQLMNYGLNEGKKTPYTGLEYSKVAADGKLYGIVREGTKFYIKVSPTKDNVLAENFEYIGGFRNRKDNEYTSFASAQKNFDFKLRSLQEAYGNGKKIVIESWNPDKNEELAVETTEKMRKEIMRERQIMSNAARIFENKAQECNGTPFCEDPDKEFKDAQKPNGKAEKVSDKGKKQDDDKTFSEKADLKKTDLKEEEVLGWNRKSEDYMDKSHGTEIGDSMPFDDAKGRDIDDAEGTSETGELKQGTVEEGAVMHTSQNQNEPAVGVSERGSDEPFDDEEGRQLDEAIDDLEGGADLEDGEAVDDAEAFEAGEELGNEEGFEAGEELGNEEGFEDSLEDEAATEEMSIEDRLSAIEDQLAKIADKLDVDTFEDDELYDDDELEAENDDEFELEADDELDGDDEFGLESDDELGGEDEFGGEDDEADEVFESRAYRKMKLKESGMKPFTDNGRVPSGNMNKLDDFGKHPAYQKKVMSLPPKDFKEFPDYYDMNDESVKNDSPYGEKIGDGTPFKIDPDAITNAIAESIIKVLKKKR